MKAGCLQTAAYYCEIKNVKMWEEKDAQAAGITADLGGFSRKVHQGLFRASEAVD